MWSVKIMWALVALLGTIIQGSLLETLRGTTLLNWPYVNRRQNGQFEGFCVDLLNELAPLMEMAYTLYIAPDGKYGGWVAQNGTINGMVGEVMRGEADFAIGDITVLTTRVRFVDFTAPFLQFGLAALVRRDVWNSAKFRNFKELSEQTSIKYGVKKYGANLPLFHNSPVVAKMYSFMDTHPSVFVEGEKEGVQKVKRERYAFIAESPFVEYVAQRDCDLVAIDDKRKHFQFEYAIAVPRNSSLKNRFSKALRELRHSGRLLELKNKYWNPSGGSRCQSTDGATTDIDTDTVNFSDRLKVPKDSTHQRSRVTDPSESYRMPHDEVDEEEIELIKPRDQNNRRNRNRRVKGNSNACTISGILLTSVLLCTALYL